MRKSFNGKLSVQRTTVKTLTELHLRSARGGDDIDTPIQLTSKWYCSEYRCGPTAAPTCGRAASAIPPCPRVPTTDTRPIE
jgi:hypothetical protein